MKSDNTQDQSLQYGLYSVQIGYMELVLYILENHSGTIATDEEDLERLSNLLSESISSNKEWMQPNDANKIKQKLQSVANNISTPRVKENYQCILDEW